MDIEKAVEAMQLAEMIEIYREMKRTGINFKSDLPEDSEIYRHLNKWGCSSRVDLERSIHSLSNVVGVDLKGKL